MPVKSWINQSGGIKKGFLLSLLALVAVILLLLLLPVTSAYVSDGPPVEEPSPAGHDNGGSADEGIPEESPPYGTHGDDQTQGESASQGMPDDDHVPGESTPAGDDDDGTTGGNTPAEAPDNDGISGTGTESANNGESTSDEGSAAPGEPISGEEAESAGAGHEAAPGNNTAGMLVDPYGTVYDATTKKAIANASVIITGAEQTEIYCDGAGKYSVVLPQGEYTITARAEGYLDYSWVFTQDENTHKIDFYLAPSGIDGDGNPIPESLSFGWCSFDNIVIIDHDIYSSGGDIEIRAPGRKNGDTVEGEPEEEPFKRITVDSGKTISTRCLGEGDNDHLTGASAGNSGCIILEASEITIGAEANILAHAVNKDGTQYTAGNITIWSEANAEIDLMDLILANVDHPRAEIKIGEDVIIKGGAVSLTAKADCTKIIFPQAGYLEAQCDTGEIEWLSGLMASLAQKGAEFIEDFSLIAAVTVSRATSLITLGENSLIEAESFDVFSASYIKASAKPKSIGLGVAVGIGASDAQVILNGKIITFGDCTIRSLADNTIQVEGESEGVKGLSAGVAVSILSSMSKVEAGETSVLQVDGNLRLEAKTIDRSFTQASSVSDEEGKVGLAVAYSQEYGETEACLGGRADVAGDILIEALMEQDEIMDDIFFGLITSTDSGVNAIAGVNTDPGANVIEDIEDDIKKQVKDKVKEFILEKIKPKAEEKSEEAEEKSEGKTSPFELAAAIAIYFDTNRVTAGIAEGAQVKSGGTLTVHALAKSEPHLLSIGAVEEDDGGDENNAGGGSGSGEGGTAGSPGGGDEEEDEGYLFGGAAAVAIGVFTNEVTSFIGSGAEVDAAGDLTVQAEFVNDYIFEYGLELITCLTRSYPGTDQEGQKTISKGDIVEVRDGHTAGGEAGNLYKYKGENPLHGICLGNINYNNEQEWENLGADWKYRATEFLEKFAGYFDGRLGLDSMTNYWIQSYASGAKLAIGGSVSVITHHNQVNARIDENAKVNQTNDADLPLPVYRTGNQNVKVVTNLTDEIVYFSGNIKLPGIEYDDDDHKITGHLFGSGAGAEYVAVGASVIIFTQNNSSRAEIKDGAMLYADNLEVKADTGVFNVVVSAAGGDAGKFGFEGTLTLLDLDNQTIAIISNQARIVVAENLQVGARDDTFIINASGVLTQSGNIGVRATVSIIIIKRDTQAVIGPQEDEGNSGKPADDEYTVIVISGQPEPDPVKIEASNDGFIASFAVAGVICKDKTEPEAGDKKQAPKGGGDYGVGVSASVVINNIHDRVLACIRLASLQAADVVISSRNYTKVIAAGGSVAIVKKEGTSAALAGSYTQNFINNVTRAAVDDSRLDLSGDLKIEAEAGEKIYSVSASGSGATSSNSGSVAGQVSVNIISSVTEASILNGSVVEAADIILTATDSSSILAVAGALAYGGKAGIGAAVAWNQIKSSDEGDSLLPVAVLVSIQNSDVNAAGDIKLAANSSNKILAITAAVGASKEGMALAATVSMNTISTNTLAYITGKKSQGLQAGGEVILDASNNSYILAVAGGLSFSKKASIGVAGSYNEISNTLAAFVGEGSGAEQETIIKAGSLILNALSDSSIISIAVGGAVGANAAVNGSVSVNTINNQVSAYIINSVVSAQTAVTLVAKDRSEIGSIAGAVGGSKTAAIGAALAVNYIGSFGGLGKPLQVLCYIEDSRVLVTEGTVSLLAQSDAIIKSISAAGGYGGKAAVYGAASLNFINTDLAAFIKDCISPGGTPEEKMKQVNTGGDIAIEAIDNSAVSVIAGNVAGAGSGAVGAAIALVFIGNGDLRDFKQYMENEEYTEEEASSEREISEDDYGYDDPKFADTSKVRVYIDRSLVESESGQVLLKATSNNAIFNITAGVAIGGKAGVQGSVSVNYIYSNVWAQILNGSRVSAEGDIRVEALSLLRESIPRGALQEGSDRETIEEFDGSEEDNGTLALTSIQSLAGAIAGGGNAGVGIALAINHITGSYLAGIEGSEVTSENGDIIVLAQSEAGIRSISAAIAGGGNLGGAGAVSLNFIHNSIIAAITGSTVTSHKTDAAIIGEKHPGIRVEAKDSSSIWSLCGQINFSGTVGIGASAGYNTIGNTVRAYISTDSRVTNRTYTVISALSEALIMTLVAGGGGGAQVSVNGSVAVNSIGNDIAAYIDSSRVLSELDIILLATDSSQIGSIAGSVGGAGMVAVGASVAVNYIGTSGNPQRVQAYILNSRVISDQGKIAIAAGGETIIKSISASGGGAGKVAVYGAVSVNWIYTDIAAFIKGCSGGDGDGALLVRAAEDISLAAIDHSAVSVIAGNIAGAGVVGVGAAVAIVFVGSGTLQGDDPATSNYKVSDAGQESEDKEFDYNQPTFTDEAKVRAFIENSNVESTGGAVKLTAKASAAIFNISAGAGVGGTAGIQGSVSVNYLNTGVSAYILKATVEAGTDILLQALSEKRTTIPKGALQVDPAPGEDLDHFDGGAAKEGEEESLETDPSSPKRLTNIQSIAGAVAGGGGAGIGAAIAVNHLQNKYLVYLSDSTLTAGGDVTLEAYSQAGIETVSAAAAAAGTFAAAGSVSLNFIKNKIEVFILSGSTTAENISLEAQDRSAIRSISGQVNFSGTAGLGAAAAYNEISNTVKAYVDRNPLKAIPVLSVFGGILIQGKSASAISTVAASGSFGVSFGGSATVVINLITNQVEAYITDALVTAGGGIYLLADSQNSTGSYGGSVGAGAVGMGAAVIVNILNNTTRAYIKGSEVSARGNGAALKVLSWDENGDQVKPDQQVHGLVVIASNKETLVIYSGSAGLGLAGASGQVSTNIIGNTTEAYIEASNINTDSHKGKWVIVRVNQNTGIQIYAGSIAAGGVAAGGAVDATFLTQQTRAYLKNSTVYAGSGVELAANTGLKPLESDQPTIIIAGASLSAMFSLAGAVSVVVTDNQNEAFIESSKVYSLGSIKVFSSHNIDLDVYGGTVSGSGFVSGGGTVVVSSFKNFSRAEVIGSQFNACESVVVMARSRDKINVKVGTTGVGVLGGGVAGAISVTLVETTTEATLKSDPVTGNASTINQDPRFRSGGSYNPGAAQNISIKADNRTEVNTLSGALGAGAYLGLGAAIDYTGIQNRTVAMVGEGSKLYTRGDINLEASSVKIVNSHVYSVGGGLFGVSGAVSVICVGQPMDSEGSEEFNDEYHEQLDNDLSPDSRLSYKDKDDKENLQSRLPGDKIGLKVANVIRGLDGPDVKGAMDPDLNTASKITAAFVQNAGDEASRAEIISGGKVTFHALGKHELCSNPSNAAAGVAAVGGTVAHIFAAENTRTYLGDYGYLRAGDLSIGAEAIALADAQCLSAAGSVILGIHVYLAHADVQPVTEAFIGDRADVAVLNDLLIEALVTPAVMATVKGLTVSGIGDEGESKAEAIVKPKTEAWIGNYATVVAGPQPVSGNPVLTLISRGSLSGTPQLEFISHTIRVNGEFIFKRGVVMSGEPELVFDQESSTLTRNDGGSWLDDGFCENYDIIISGTWENDGTYTIAGISADEKILTLSESTLIDETTGSSKTEVLSGVFTLVNNEDKMLTLNRTDGEGWSWAGAGFLPGDLLTLEKDGVTQDLKISGMDGARLLFDISAMNAAQQLFLAHYLEKNASLSLASVSLKRIARLVSIKAVGDLANDRVKYVGAAGESLVDKGLKVDDYFTLLVGSPLGVGHNSDVYKIIGFKDGGFTAILDTQGYVVSTPEGETENGAAGKELSPELKRTGGSWLTDGFLPGDIIRVGGTLHNDGYYEIKEISADGRILVFHKGEVVTGETVSAGAAASVTSLGYDRISRDSGSWEADGFKPGQSITIDGSGQNNGIYRVRAISGDGKHLFLEAQGVLEQEASKDIVITIAGSYDSTVSVKAAVLLPVNPDDTTGTTARAEADGISGSLLASINGIYATADVNTQAQAYVGAGANIKVLGIIEVNATAATKQTASTNSVNIGGGLSISDNSARVNTASIINAGIGEVANIKGNELQILAYGHEYSYAVAVAGSGGAISGLAAEAKTASTSHTNAAIGNGARIDAGLFSLLAEHNQKFNSRVDTVNASLVGASGGLAENNVISWVDALIDAGAVINAYNILVTAINGAEKEWLSGGTNNVNSGSGGIADFPASRSHTDISFETNVTVGGGAKLNVIGDPLLPGSLTMNAFNHTVARDRVKLAAGGMIAVATAESKIKADVYRAAINIGENAALKSVGDINLSSLAQAEIETRADVETWGAASAANGVTLSRVTAENTVAINGGAKLFAEGSVNLMAGENSDGQMNNLNVRARTDIDNNGVLPVSTTPRADGIINLTNYINIKVGALVQSVSDTNLIAEKGPTLASGKATGRDWVKDIFGAEIKGGSGLLTLDPLVRVDGTVEAGLRSERYLEIGADGQIARISDGITLTWEKAIQAEHLLSQINHFKYLAVQYAGTEAGSAFAAQAQFLIQELSRMGIDISGNKPLPLVWIDLIIVGGIKAEQPNINVLAEGGSLVGNGILSACATPAKIEIVNRSPHYLVLTDLLIPEREGGLLFYNYTPVLGDDLNEVLNLINQVKEADFTITTSGSAGSQPSSIYIENTDGGLNPPAIEIRGSIKNVGTQANPGLVTIKGHGGISCLGSIEAGTLEITAGGSFMQGYVDYQLDVGGSPRAHWGELAQLMQGEILLYPLDLGIWGNLYDPVLLQSYKILLGEGYLALEAQIKQMVSSILSANNPQVGAIRADNIFIAARYLNINGTIEAGRSLQEVTLGHELDEELNFYRVRAALVRIGLLAPFTYEDCPLVRNERGFNIFYDPILDAIIVEPLKIRGGYVELFGQIINTGGGKIIALDGFGQIKIDNQTDLDLVIKGLDTGLGMPGTVVITDTARKKEGCDNDVYTVTRYRRIYDPNTGSYQVEIHSYYSDDSNHLIEDSTVGGSSAEYQPVQGYRYEWVMGQKIGEEEIITYRSKDWLGADWAAKDPGNLYDRSTYMIGTPVLMPEGEYLRYAPEWQNEPYVYHMERRTTDSRELWGYRNWSEKAWFLGYTWHYEEYTYRKGSIDVFYRSVKADYPIAIEFAGERVGSIDIYSGGDIVLDGPIGNEAAATTLKAGGSIRSNTEQPIVSGYLTLEAGRGIGDSLPLLIALSGGTLKAETTAGDINIREIYGYGYLNLEQICAASGNVRLEAGLGIKAAGSDSLIKGKQIELVTTEGSIGGDLSGNSALRIDSGEGEGSGLIARAQKNINLEEISGSLWVVSVVSETGDVTLAVPGGSLRNPSYGEYQHNSALLALWEEYMAGKEATPQNIAAFLDKAYLKHITDTSYREVMPNIVGNNISLSAAGAIGGDGWKTFVLFDDDSVIIEIGTELKSLLAAAEPGDVAFYNKQGQAVDPAQAFEIRVRTILGIGVQAAGKVALSAGGSIYLFTAGDLQLETAGSANGGNVRIKSGGGIFNAADSGAVNVRGGDIVLEASGGPIGVAGKPITVQQWGSKILSARSAYDIYLQGVQGGYADHDYDGSLNLGFIYTTLKVVLSSPAAITGARNDEKENITAASLLIEAASVGQNGEHLKLDLAGILLGEEGNLTVLASAGDIYLTEVEGNMYIGTVVASFGNVFLWAGGSIFGAPLEQGAPNIRAGNINLQAVNGVIGHSDQYLLISTLGAGELSTESSGDLYISAASGDLALGRVFSSTGDVYLQSSGSITGGNPGGTNISCGKANLLAAGDIGAASGYLRTNVNNLEIRAESGSIWIQNHRGLIIGGFPDKVALSAAGEVHLIVLGDLQVLENITAGSSLTANVLGSMQVLENITAGGALTADVSGRLEVEGNITAGGDLDLTTVDTVDGGEDIRVQAGVVISSVGGSVTLRAADDLLLPAGSLLAAAERIFLYLDFSAGNPDPGVGGKLELFGEIYALLLEIYGGEDGDTILIQTADPLPQTVIRAGAGDDVIILDQPGPVPDQYGMETDIYGDAGDDTFQLYSCRGDLLINGDDGDDHFDLLFDGQTLGEVILDGGRGDDYFNLAFSSEYLESVTLNGGEGDDTFNFADGVVLNGVINGGAGLDTLDYSHYNSARHINLNGWDENGYSGVEEGSDGPECTILGGFYGIRQLIGSLAATDPEGEPEGNKLYGIQEVGGQWLLDGENSTYQAEGAADGEGNLVTLNFRNFDYLFGGNREDTFTLTGREYGCLFGGNGNDSFIMLDGATLEGATYGGEGNNTLDYRAYTTGVIVNLSTFSATGISGLVTGINIVYGGQGDDHLIGDERDNILASTGGSDLLEGGSGNNTYLIYESFGTVQIIETLQGEDTLSFFNVLSDLVFELDERLVNKLDGGQVTGSVSYGGPGIAGNNPGDRIRNLIGGSGSDTFNLSGSEQQLHIESGAGDDTFNFSGNGVLNGNIDSGVGGDTFNFSDQATVLGDINGGPGDDTFNFAGSTIVNGDISGGEGSDIFNFNGSVTLLGLTEGGPGDDLFIFAGTGLIRAQVMGGAGDDHFCFSEQAIVQGLIDGGEGQADRLDFSACPAALNLVLTDLGSVNGFSGQESARLAAFDNINYLIGTNSDQDDSLRGLNQGGRFILSATYEADDIWNLYQDLAASSTLYFGGFEILKGGSGENFFMISGEQPYDLYGGPGSDNFVFRDGGRLASGASGRWGNLDGGSGANTLDFSAYTTRRVYRLTAAGPKAGFNGLEEALAGEFRNITELTGSQAEDSLIGLDRDSTWELTGAGSGVYRTANRSLAFSGLKTLQGGTKNDRFRLFDGVNFSGHLDGGGGSNTLDYRTVTLNIEVNLATSEASLITGTFSAIQNVTGGFGDDLITGNDGPNILDGGPGNDTIYGGPGNDTIYGGPGNDYLDGGEGDDVLYTGSGHNILVGGDGTDKAIVSYRSTYEHPLKDIEIWVFLRPPAKEREKTDEIFSGKPEKVSQLILSATGGKIEFSGGSLNIPAGVLPGDAVITVRTLNLSEVISFLPAMLKLKLVSRAYEITSSGAADFGKDKFVIITLEFDYDQLPAGGKPALYYYDSETGRWLALETTISFNEQSGKWEASAKVNHMGIFAVLAAI